MKVVGRLPGKIRQFGTARSGSTLCYNAIRFLVADRKIIKLHSFKIRYIFQPLIVTTREPLDSVVSMLTKGGLLPTDENVIDVSRILWREGFSQVRLAKRLNVGLFLDYDRFYGDNAYLLRSIADYLAVPLSQSDIDRFVMQFSVEEVRKSTKDKPFATWDKATKFHGSHVSESLGRPGAGMALSSRQKQIVSEILEK